MSYTKRVFWVIFFILFSFTCFAQQNVPRRIIGQIPSANSTGTFQIQVGAFRVAQNAEALSGRLRAEGFNIINEEFFGYTRVKISGVPAHQVLAYLSRIKQLGFDEVIIKADSSPIFISEKFEISTPDSPFSSFEFNQDLNYIAVEGSRIHFGDYYMPSMNVINMEGLGVLRINEDSENIDISFSPLNDPHRETRFTASRAERLPESSEMDLFCRTWRVVNSTDTEMIGSYILISNAGTYFFSFDGETNSLSQWRWYNNDSEEFEYSHNNWRNFGRAQILELTPNSLKIFDPGFNQSIPGYSSAGFTDIWEMVPGIIQ